jgi:quercetin dioxygenase-like cupin family protein
MAPPLTGKSLILHPRYAQGSDAGGGARNHVVPEKRDGKDPAQRRRTKEATMTTRLVALVLLAALLMLAAVPTEAADVTELFATDLADHPGKEGRMIEVSYPPGARDVVHRHDAHAFVYVLEGQIVMQLKGQPAVTLKAGQTFYEGPTDVHVVGRNASNTEPARFVVVLLKAKGAPILVPVE